MSACDDMPCLVDDCDEFQTYINPPHVSVNPEVASEDEDVDGDDEGDWEDMEEIIVRKTKCLFCDDTLPSVQISLTHMIDLHGFDLVSFICKFSFDQIDYIKLINYVRQEKPLPENLRSVDVVKWSSIAYMKPVIAEDSLLMCDVRELTNSQEFLGCESDTCTFQATCNELREIIDRQREVMQRMLQSVQANSKNDEVSVKTVGDLRPEEDEGYFNSYAHFDIHHEMLSDQVRTESYRDAILKNSTLLNGKKVLDLGCGTAILSMFCAKAGAIVTGVDMSDVIYQAIDIVKENQLDSAITLCKGRLEDLHFEHKFDYIVSEWMGYFLLFEGMLDSVLYAREKHLAEGGLLLPNRCTMHLVGMEDMDTHKRLVGFWDNVYGFKMSCMRRDVIKEASTDIVKKQCIVTSADQIADFDLMTITPGETEFTTNFSLIVTRDGQLTGFVGYFDVYFKMPNPVFFSTGPHATPTHWKQTVFYLPEPCAVRNGEVLEGTISVCRKRKDLRALDVGINFGNQKLKYLLE
ncbi:protein arginine N-methyltransferase 1-like isoform X2 [Panulirus ornatus]